MKVIHISNYYASFKNNVLPNYNNKDIICLVRLAPTKGIDQMIDIFNSISDSHPEWKLNIYADGQDKDIIIDKIAQYNLNEKITLNSFIKDVKNTMLQH